MTEPKLMTAEELDDLWRRINEKHFVSTWDAVPLRDHIAALEAALAAAHAAVRAGDKMAEPKEYKGVIDCAVCAAAWSPYPDGDPEWHADDCPVPAWRTARAGVKMQEDGNDQA